MGQEGSIKKSCCVNCGAELTGPWCSQCGEQVRKPGDLSLKAYLAELLDALTNLEGRFWGSLRALLFKPGLLTSDYMAGKRVRWMRPLHLFLFINLIYFFVSAWNTFTTELHWHIGAEGFLHQPVASRLVNQALNDPPLAEEEWRQVAASLLYGPPELSEDLHAARETLINYGRLFNSRVDIFSRTLIISVIPLMMLAPLVLMCLRRQSPIVHLVLATHWTAFFLVLSMVIGWLVIALVWLGWLPGDDRLLDTMATLSLLALGFAWTLPAVRRVYGLGWTRAMLLAAAINVWWLPALMLYRAVLFFQVFCSV
ncbi:MAG: DUF3667 domain-containing protein [Wenzhouxiangella sp.]|nr:DUF3667 domain-containing protein [Wenzhouxiangella sp.]MCH8477888.1 DUF3667 domain-containing protein [Wenzhouxiangella sp.]